MKKLLATVILSTSMVSTTYALEVDREVMPRVTLGGRVIATYDANELDSNKTKEDEINLEDSTIMARFDKRMFGDGVAGATLGFTEHDDNVEFNHLYAFYWNRDFEVDLGKTKLPNTIIEFPLIRDDDFLDYTHVGNASSNEGFDQIYGTRFKFDWFVDRENQKLTAWTGTRRNGSGFSAPDGMDTFGYGYRFERAEEYQYLKWIRNAGVLVDNQKVTLATGDEWMTSVIAGIEFNLNMNPLANWSMAAQAISNEGVGTITSSDIVHTNSNARSNRARAKSNALVTSIRYTRRPNLLTRFQAGLNLGYKDYSDVNDASQWSIAPNVAFRIGQGVDMFGQIKYTDYGNGLGGGSDTVYQVGMSFSLETMFNENIGERNSIMNLEHGYIK